jgi:Lar family restriction alleviation protein
MDNSELKPCPFCGANAETSEYHEDVDTPHAYHSYTVRCKGCAANITSYHDGIDWVIKQWNKRV